MARTYKRDSNGRFAGGGGSSGGSRGGSGSKAAATKATNKARAADLKAKGTTMLGKRVKPKGFAGGKKVQQKAGGLMLQSNPRRNLAGTGSKLRKPLKGGAKPVKAAARKRPAKTSKAPTSAAKAKYKAATSKVRELKMYRAGKTDQTVRNAQRAVKRMEQQRGTGQYKVPKAVQAIARAAAATYVAGQAARWMVSGRGRRKR